MGFRICGLRALVYAAATLIVSTGVTGCSITRGVRPVGESQLETGISLGGPIFTNLRGPMPVPLVAAYGRYGVGEKTDVDAALHFPVSGAAGIDAGAAHLVLEQQGAAPALMLGGRGYLFFDARGINPVGNRFNPVAPRVFAEAHGTASWALPADFLVWTGAQGFVQFTELAVRPAIKFGGSWAASDSVSFAAELGWLAMASESNNLAVRYVGLGGRGAISAQIGAAYRWGKI